MQSPPAQRNENMKWGSGVGVQGGVVMRGWMAYAEGLPGKCVRPGVPLLALTKINK